MQTAGSASWVRQSFRQIFAMPLITAFAYLPGKPIFTSSIVAAIDAGNGTPTSLTDTITSRPSMFASTSSGPRTSYAAPSPWGNMNSTPAILRAAWIAVFGITTFVTAEEAA